MKQKPFGGGDGERRRGSLGGWDGERDLLDSVLGVDGVRGLRGGGDWERLRASPS